jgi:tetratricopeptide (TPR) repeat protein
MTNRWKTAALLAAAFGLVISGPAAGVEDPAEPFFHQFLTPGDPFDERLLAQEKLVAANPDSAALRNDFGNLLTERRFAKEARAEYQKALQLDPKFFIAAYNLGLLEETEGRVSAAMSAYREAIERRRGFPPAHFRLGRLYEKTGRIDDAIQEYAKAIRIDDTMRNPRRNPLVVDSRLIDQASLYNYPRDIARATLPELGYVDAVRLRPVPVDRTLDANEVVEETGPQTIDTKASSPPAGNRAPPMAAPGRPPTTRPPRGVTRRDIAPRPAEPAAVPTPVRIENVPPPEPDPEPQPEPQPERQT